MKYKYKKQALLLCFYEKLNVPQTQNKSKLLLKICMELGKLHNYESPPPTCNKFCTQNAS